jgi:citrate synthase
MSAPELNKATVAKGLKGVVVAETSICDVNGSTGLLTYRGYNVDDLAQSSTFEEVAYLLLYGHLPNPFQLDDFRTALGRQANLPEPIDEFLRHLPENVAPMAALQAAVAFAGLYDLEDDSLEASFRKSVRLVARLPTIVAVMIRLCRGQTPIPPDLSLSAAGNFLWMLTGRKPTADETRAMDLILILHAEHGFNASTFAGRVIIATLSDVYSAVAGAIGALKGKLHGGANTEVLKELQEIGGVENVDAWVQAVVARKGKFMGFGHAVYRTEDPRAKHLQEMSRCLGVERGDTRLYDISVALENRVTATIEKHCNVDFYSASVQHALGIPGDSFTCVFAVSRIVGWCAHILEQLADNKIIRPSAEYIGFTNRRYVPLDER